MILKVINHNLFSWVEVHSDLKDLKSVTKEDLDEIFFVNS